MENIGNGLPQRVAEKMGTPGAVAARFKTDQTRGDDEDSDDSDNPTPQIAKRQTITERKLQALETQATKKKNLLNASDIRDNIAVKKDLDISFVTVDTIKSLFKFMSIEAGDEGEKSIESILKAQGIDAERRPAGSLKRKLTSKSLRNSLICRHYYIG